MPTHLRSAAQPKLPGLEQSDTKTCTKCKKVKPLSLFGNNRKCPDGLQYWCKACQSGYQKGYTNTANGREKMREARRKWAEKPGNKAKIRAATKRWLNTDEGRRKNRESQQKYFQTERGKEKLRIANERLRPSWILSIWQREDFDPSELWEKEGVDRVVVRSKPDGSVRSKAE